MSKKYPGGIIRGTPVVPTATSASGIWTTDQAQNYSKAGIWPRSPGAPTSVTATATSGTAASVAFTAPADTGSASITTYTVTSSPGGIVTTGSSSPIAVTGLTTNITYTFTVTATNGAGTGPVSAASNSVTPTQIGGNIGPAYAISDSYIYSTIAGLSSTAMLVCYRQNSTGYFVAAVGSISGTSISYGSPTTISTITPSFRPASCALSSTTGLVAWADGSTSYIAAMSISGSTVTVGSAVNTGYYTQNGVALASLTATTALAMFRDVSGNKMQAFVVSVSGTTVSLGTAVAFGSQNDVSVLTTLSSTAAVGFYGGNTTYMNSIPLTVSGTTVSAGTIQSDQYLGVYAASGANVNASYVVETAGTASGSDQTRVRLVSNAGTAQTNYNITNSSFDRTMTTCPDGANIQICYTAYSPTAFKVAFLSASGTSLVAQSGTSIQTVSDTNGWLYGTACTISSTKTAFSYWNTSGSANGISVSVIY